MSYYKTCPVCKCNFKWHTSKQKYCSDACKQKAYRLAHGQREDTWNVIRERARKGASTKAGISVQKLCLGCNESFYANGNNYGMMDYCSNACKQRAYRKRKAQGN